MLVAVCQQTEIRLSLHVLQPVLDSAHLHIITGLDVLAMIVVLQL